MTNETPTPQEFFDRTATHLLKQNERSVDQEGGCMYRGPQGLRCAIGIWIPDSVYDASMEGAYAFDICGYDGMDHLRGIDLTYLEAMQLIHDTSEPDQWPRLLAEFAEREDLDSSVLDEF